MSAQGILETPVTSRGPTLLNPGGFAYGYHPSGAVAPRCRRLRSTYERPARISVAARILSPGTEGREETESLQRR
jgi:hypothetical protein